MISTHEQRRLLFARKAVIAISFETAYHYSLIYGNE
jgi:hypothetical protein